MYFLINYNHSFSLNTNFLIAMMMMIDWDVTAKGLWQLFVLICYDSVVGRNLKNFFYDFPLTIGWMSNGQVTRALLETQ